MIDINLIKEQPERIIRALRKRMAHIDFEELLSWDEEKRFLIVKSDLLKSEKNKSSKRIGELKKQEKNCETELHKIKTITDRIKVHDERIKQLENRIHNFLSRLRNKTRSPKRNQKRHKKQNKKNKHKKSWGHRCI